MASNFTRLQRAITEYQNYFTHELVEYKYVEAYKHLREGEGWVVSEYDTELYTYVKNIYNCIYGELAYKLEKGYPATDREIYECFRKSISCLQNDSGAIENIYRKSENDSIVTNASLVQDLAKRATEKFNELITLANEDIIEVQSFTNQHNYHEHATHNFKDVSSTLIRKESTLLDTSKKNIKIRKESKLVTEKVDELPLLEPIELSEKGYNIKVAFKQISPQEVSNVKEGIQKAVTNSLYRTEKN